MQWKWKKKKKFPFWLYKVPTLWLESMSMSYIRRYNYRGNQTRVRIYHAAQIIFYIYWFDGCRAWKTFKKLTYFLWFPKRKCHCRRCVSRVLLCSIDFMSFWRRKKRGNYTWANSSKNVKIVNGISMKWTNFVCVANLFPLEKLNELVGMFKTYFYLSN